MESKTNFVYSLSLVLLLVKAYCYASHCETAEYPVESQPLSKPPMEDIVEALQNNLTTIFQNVEVSIVQCPDLRKHPFHLASEGISGSPTHYESGSEKYLFPVPIKSKVYDFKDVPQQTGVYPTFMIGAGSGPFLYLKSASENIPNLKITHGQVHSLSQIGTVKHNKLYTKRIPAHVTKYGFMQNLFVSQGKRGKVIKVKVSKRIGDDNFISTIRETLRNAFPDEAIALGGTFLVKNSRVHILVQPQFSKVPLATDEMKQKWLRFFNVSSPLVGVGTLITNDPGLSLRPYHFHLLSHHNEAGHYLFDLDPDTVEYTGFFNVAEQVVRVDKPPA